MFNVPKKALSAKKRTSPSHSVRKTFSELPDELTLQIFHQLPPPLVPRDLLRLSHVCQQWRRISLSSEVWKPFRIESSVFLRLYSAWHRASRKSLSPTPYPLESAVRRFSLCSERHLLAADYEKTRSQFQFFDTQT